MKKQFLTLLLSAMTLGSTAFSAEQLAMKGNRNISSFGEAKRELKKIYSGHEQTIYCGCKYYGKEVNMNSCHAYSPGQTARFKKLEWEHVVPAQKFGEVVQAWGAGDESCANKRGRKCAEKASPLFRQMEGDLYNLWPESGGINGARSNKPPRESVSGDVQTFGECETVIGKKAFAPRPEVRGEVARSYLYMRDVYQIPLTQAEVEMFQAWNKADPVDQWECERAQRIKKVQGNANPYVEEPCTQAKF